MPRSTIVWVVALLLQTTAFAPPRAPVLRGPEVWRRVPVARAADKDDGNVDFDAAFRARVRDSDVREFRDRDRNPLDAVPLDVKAAFSVEGREAAGGAAVALGGALALLAAGIFLGGTKSPLKAAAPAAVAEPAAVCISGNCNRGEQVRFFFSPVVMRV